MTQESHISVTLTPEIRLEQALKEAGVKDPATITHLDIAGTFTDEDEKYLEKNLGENLQEVDFSNCTSVSSFMEDIFQKDNLQTLKEKHGYVPIQKCVENPPIKTIGSNTKTCTKKRAIVVGRYGMYIFHFPQ